MFSFHLKISILDSFWSFVFGWSTFWGREMTLLAKVFSIFASLLLFRFEKFIRLTFRILCCIFVSTLNVFYSFTDQCWWISSLILWLRISKCQLYCRVRIISCLWYYVCNCHRLSCKFIMVVDGKPCFSGWIFVEHCFRLVMGQITSIGFSWEWVMC